MNDPFRPFTGTLAAASLAVLAACLPARGEDDPSGTPPFLSAPLVNGTNAVVAIERAEADEEARYKVVVEIPGVRDNIEVKRMRFAPGQTTTNVVVTLEEVERRTASISLEDPLHPPFLPLGLSSGKPTEVRFVRAEPGDEASYRVEVIGAREGDFALSSPTLRFPSGATNAALTVTAAFSRQENCALRLVNEADASDRLRVQLPVDRDWMADFENNFYICFRKEIRFGEEEVRQPDGTVLRKPVYKPRWHYLTNGLRITLTVALCAVCLGAVLGFLVAIVRTTHDKHGRLRLLNALAKVYITVIRGTPMTVQLLIAYFIIFSSINNKVLVAILAFGVNSGAYVAEIIRAGITSIDDGQMEAARSLGLSYGQGMRRIVLPQAIRNVLPALGNEFIVMLKDTSIASFIGLDDLARGGSIIRSQTYQAYIPFLAVAGIYLMLVMIFSKLLTRLERHLHRTGAK